MKNCDVLPGGTVGGGGNLVRTRARFDAVIELDQLFVGEDGMEKPFWQFQKNDYLCCHGENTPSGCVFAQGVGYHCFGCN
jgi:hypothetical protein